MRLPSRVDEDELERTIAAGGREGEIYGALRDLRDRYADRIRTGLPNSPRRISGFNLDRLLPENGLNLAAAFVGSESTCGLVLGARCRLVTGAQWRSLGLLGSQEPFIAAE